MVRRDDERAASLQAAGAQVVVGDLLGGRVRRTSLLKGTPRQQHGCKILDRKETTAFCYPEL